MLGNLISPLLDLRMACPAAAHARLRQYKDVHDGISTSWGSPQGLLLGDSVLFLISRSARWM